jgi:hypothetical protein
MINEGRHKSFIKDISDHIQVFLLFTGLLFIVACVEEYWPDMGNKYDQLIVVDGMITNLPPPYTIKLSLSTTVDNPQYRPLSGYEIVIMDDTGQQETLQEKGFGVYQTDVNGIQGAVGRSYRIQINSPPGDIYQSDFVKLLPPVGIDTLTHEIEYKQDFELDHDLVGFQFYVNSLEAPKDSTWFLWKIIETYKYNANYRIKYVFDGSMHIMSHPDSLYTCWKTDTLDEIFTFNTLNLAEPRITNLPLQYINTETKRLSLKYSALVRQFNIDMQSYQFWNKLEEQSADQGSLYTSQPYQIRGNIYNPNDLEEPVLGYFMVAGLSEKRFFYDKPQALPFYYEDECAFITEELYTVLLNMESQWPLYLYAVFSEFGSSPALPGGQECVNCEVSGGSIVEPDFWIE